MFAREQCNVADRVDQIADRFENAFKTGRRPSIADYLELTEREVRTPLLLELIKLDLEYRKKFRESPQIHDYVAEFPELNQSQKDMDELVLFRRRLFEEKPADTYDAARPVHCPQCGHPFEISHELDSHMTCSACGSSFEVNRTTLVPSEDGGPKVIGKFHIEMLVGVGSFGAVYRARDIELGRIVALKIPRSGYFPSCEDRERFLREARGTAKLDHPGIVPVYEVGHEDEVPYIVCGFVDGSTLADSIAQRRFEPREAAQLVEQVARAVHYANQHDLVHRDIKPTNILLDRAGNPHVTDFGVAHHDATDLVLTVDGQIVGTPAYMSPEQAAGDSSSVDRRSDVYSLGVVLYELLVGERPFRGNTRMLLDQVLNQEPRSPRALNDRIPRDLETICLKAMEKAPAQRFETAAELADDLRRFVDSKPIHARAVSNFGRFTRWCKRNPRTSALSAVIVVGLLVSGVATTITSLLMSDLASSEKQARVRAQVLISRSRAESGILKLQRGNALGLLDLNESFEPVADNDDELRSRVLLTTGWIADVDGRLMMLVGENAPLSSGAFSPNGTVFATCTDKGTLQVWDTATGRLLAKLTAHPHSPYHTRPRFSSNGNLIAVAPNFGPHSTVWDWKADSRKLVSLDVKGGCSNVELLSDGTFVGVFWDEAENGQRIVRVWDLESNSMIAGPFPVSGGELYSVSRDGKNLAVFSDDHPSGFWHLPSGNFTALKVTPHSEGIVAVAFSPDGNLFASGSFDDQLRIWSTNTADCLATIPHKEDVRDLAFSPDGKVLASASFDSNVFLWDTTDFKPVAGPLRHDGPVLTVAFNRDGTLLASGGGGRVRVWSVPNGQLVAGPFDHQNVVENVTFHPKSNLLLSVSRDGSARIWNPQKPDTLVFRIQHPNRVWTVDFSSDGQNLATSSENGLAFVWDVATGTQVREPIFHGPQLLSARFNPIDGNELITSGSGQLPSGWAQIKFWDVGTGAPSRKTPDAEAWFRPTRLAPNGEYLVVGTDANGAWLFDLRAETVLAKKTSYSGKIHDVAFHPDGKRFATACIDGLVRVFSAADLSEKCKPLVHNSAATAVTFSPDGQLIASASEDMSIQLWRTDNWQPYGSKIPQNAAAQSLAFSPDSRSLASASSSGLVQLWDVQTVLPVGPPLHHDAWATSVAFSADGRLLATGSFDNTACLWQLPGNLDVGEIETLKLRIWVALGARKNARGDFETLTGQEWSRLRDRLYSWKK